MQTFVPKDSRVLVKPNIGWDVPLGKRLTRAKVHESLLDADVFINVSVLKHHNSSMVTIGTTFSSPTTSFDMLFCS
jgi:uncharacterized protein (DUF362 family)